MKKLVCAVLVLVSATFCFTASAMPDGTNKKPPQPHQPPHRK